MKKYFLFVALLSVSLMFCSCDLSTHKNDLDEIATFSLPSNYYVLDFDCNENLFEITVMDNFSMSLKLIVIDSTSIVSDRELYCLKHISDKYGMISNNQLFIDSDDNLIIGLMNNSYASIDLDSGYSTFVDIPNSFQDMDFIFDVIPFYRPCMFDSSILFPFGGNVDYLLKKDVQSYFSKLSPFGIYNLTTMEASQSLITYPSDYTHNYYHDLIPSICSSKDALIISFGASDSIYVYNYDFQKINNEIAKSLKMNNLKPFDIADTRNFTKFKDYIMHASRYTSMIYDPYFNRFFRLFNFYEKDSLMWGFVVLDEKLHKKDEFVFSSEEYSPLLFPTEKGIILLNLNNSKMINNFKVSLLKI